MTTPIGSWVSKWMQAMRAHPGDWIIERDEAWRTGRLYWHPKAVNDNSALKTEQSK